MDGIIAIGVCAVLVGVCVWAGLPYWASFWGVVLVVLGIWEAYAKARKGLTISQMMWKLHAERPKTFWAVWAVFAAFFAGLLVHLAGLY